MNSEINKKYIVDKASILMAQNLKPFGFEPSRRRNILVHNSERNKTDFKVFIGFYADRRHGGYAFDPFFEIRMPPFEEIFYKFRIEFAKSNPPLFAIRKGEIFYRATFSHIRYAILRELRPTINIYKEDDIFPAVSYFSFLYESLLHDWVQCWLSWETARNLLDRNSDMCGAWRNTAYFTMLERGFGTDEACSWLSSRVVVEKPKIQSAQLLYLRTRCSKDMMPPTEPLKS